MGEEGGGGVGVGSPDLTRKARTTQTKSPSPAGAIFSRLLFFSPSFGVLFLDGKVWSGRCESRWAVREGGKMGKEGTLAAKIGNFEGARIYSRSFDLKFHSSSLSARWQGRPTHASPSCRSLWPLPLFCVPRRFVPSPLPLQSTPLLPLSLKKERKRQSPFLEKEGGEKEEEVPLIAAALAGLVITKPLFPLCLSPSLPFARNRGDPEWEWRKKGRPRRK